MEESISYINRILKELNLDGLDAYTQNTFDGKITFSSLLSQLILMKSGKDMKDAFFCWVRDLLFYELQNAKPIFFEMILFATIFAVMNQFFMKKKGYVTTLSFFIVYGTMMVWLLSSFSLLKEVVEQGVASACHFFTLLIPTYSAILLISGNPVSAGSFYELSFALICAIEWLIKLVFLPGIHIYVILGMIDHFFEEERLSKFSELIERGIYFLLKITMSSVLGLGTVRSMLSIGQDHVTQNTILKSMSAMPGIGNGFRFAQDVVFSCGILVKNCIGIAGVIILFIVCLMPIIKIFSFAVLYQLMAAILQPFSDRRIVDGVTKIANGCRLYLKVMVDTMLLCMITVALLTVTTTYT